MDNKLLPCPFCGGVAVHEIARGAYPHMIRCTKCDARTGGSAFKNTEYNVKAWNKRFDIKCSHPDRNCAVKCNA